MSTSKNLSQIVLIALCMSQVLTNCPIAEVAENISDCTGKSKPGNRCCHLSTMFETNFSICIQLSSSVYDGLKTYSMGGILYNIDCGEEEFDSYKNVRSGTPCGRADPQNVEDCRKYSTLKSSCCLTTTKESTGCYHIGRKYSGVVPMAGGKLEC